MPSFGLKQGESMKISAVAVVRDSALEAVN